MSKPTWWQSLKSDSSFIREYLWKYRRLVFWGLLALGLVDVLEIVPPLLLKDVIDSIGKSQLEQKLMRLSLIYISVTVVQAIGRFGWRFFLIRTSMNAGRDLRERYTGHLFNLSSSFFDRKKIGDLMSLATSDIDAIRMAMGGGLIILADAVIYLIVVPIAMIGLSWKLTLLCCLPMLIVPTVVIRNERLINERFKAVQEAFSHLSALVQENLSGLRVVKGFARENAQIARFKKAGENYLHLNMLLSRVNSSFGPLLDFIMSLGLMLLLYFGGASVLDGALTLGTFIAFQRYIQKIVWPMTAVGLAVTFYQRAVTGSDRLKKVLKESTDTPEPSAPLLPTTRIKNPRGRWRTPGAVEIRNLSFRYSQTEKFVLENISLKIEPGQRVAFVGSIGSGKTTLLSLIPRLYPVPVGTVFVDGIDVNHWPLCDLRDQIGYVSQDTFLFNETVFENVAFGLFDMATRDLREPIIHEATSDAAVQPDILKFEQSYETRLSERGGNVSGGQRQRLTLARALATEPSILILDDSLSAVDVETEEMILSGLRARTKRNTEIVAAHRISTVQEADRIYVLDKGRLVQKGTHKELLREHGQIYWRFYEQQRLQEEVDQYVSQLET